MPNRKPKKNKKPSKLTETQQKIRANQAKIDRLHAYKDILRDEGLKPSQDDKQMESELIVKQLRLERRLADLTGQPPPATRKYKYFSKSQPKSS